MITTVPFAGSVTSVTATSAFASKVSFPNTLISTGTSSSVLAVSAATSSTPVTVTTTVAVSVVVVPSALVVVTV